MRVSEDAEPVLRLAGVACPQHGAEAARGEAAHENKAASKLSADDAAAILAIRTIGSLQAGRAAVLTPERRATLVGGAVRLGMNPFDAHLVIAMVQSAVRAGDDPLARLRLLRTGVKRSDRRWLASRAVRLLIAALAAAAVVAWVVLSMGAAVGSCVHDWAGAKIR